MRLAIIAALLALAAPARAAIYEQELRAAYGPPAAEGEALPPWRPGLRALYWACREHGVSLVALVDEGGQLVLARRKTGEGEALDVTRSLRRDLVDRRI